ncbi:MAG: hypothetical protein AAGF11_25785 [Myxococcota bacterium]
MMDETRRRFLRNALLGPFGLKALATGLPVSFFVAGFPRGRALASEPAPPQFLILSNNDDGDPINANAPGTYGVAGVVHNPAPSMAETSINLGNVATSAAAPWATLPQSVLDRTCLIHHRTYQNIHPQHNKVMGLVGSAKTETGTGNEHLATVLAHETADKLGTVQRDPVAVGGGRLTSGGRTLQTIEPRTLSHMFSPLDDEGLALAQLRDTALDEIHERLRESSTPAQRTFIERYATSREQVKAIDESLLDRFASINGNGPSDQISAAIGLIEMRISPVIGIGLSFGGDNHADGGLEDERDGTVSGMADLVDLFAELEATGLSDQVTFASFNVFGRTLKKKGLNGRDHNLNHHVMMISGPNVTPGVFGGIAPSGNDFGATAIDSVSGLGMEGGDIPEDETLESAAKTLGQLVGMDAERTDFRIDGGKVIEAAVTG